MLVTFWANNMDVQTEKNCALYLHMYENAERSDICLHYLLGGK